MLRLGQIIHLLEGQPKNNGVQFDFCRFNPGHLTSYRGYYDQLALTYEMKEKDPTVSEILQMMKAAVGATFQGYKGGDFMMDEDTPVWVAEYGSTSETVLTGITAEDYFTIFHTGYYEG